MARARPREAGASEAGAIFGILLVFVALWVLPYLLCMIVYGGPVVLTARFLFAGYGSRVATASYVLMAVWLQGIMPAWCRDLSGFIATHIHHPVALLAPVYGALSVATVGSMLMSAMFVIVDISRMRPADWRPSRPASTGRRTAEKANCRSGHARPRTREEPYCRAKPKAAAAEPTRVETWADILGVPGSASLGEIRAAYRREAMRWHPDRFFGSPATALANAEGRMRSINAAYEEAKRRSASA